MGDDRIKGQDLYGDTWRAQVRPGNRIEIEATENGHVAGAMLSPTDAARLSFFLLSAADIDLVGAARKVVEAHGAAEKACACGDLYPDEKPCIQCTEHRPLVTASVDALASELAKLDAVRA